MGISRKMHPFVNYSPRFVQYLKKARFMADQITPLRNSALRGNFLGLRPRGHFALGSRAQSEIHPTDQSGKLRAGLHIVRKPVSN